MPTKLIVLTEAPMELAQAFHKQNLSDQRDLERWDLKLSQHDPTCTVLVLSCFVMLCLIWSFMVIYEHIWAYMIQYEHIRMDMSGWHVCKLLQHMPFSKLQSWKLSGVRFQVSVKHEQPQQRSARFEDIQNISKHYYFAFPNWCLQKRLVKKWLNHLQKSSNHQTSMEVLSVLSILSILRPSWSCLSSLFRLLNNSRERSNHKQSQVFFCGQYCLLSTVVICYDLFM